MSIPVEGDIKKTYIPQVPYEELDKRYQVNVLCYLVLHTLLIINNE